MPAKGKSQPKAKKEGGPMTKSEKAGLNFPVARIMKQMKSMK